MNFKIKYGATTEMIPINTNVANVAAEKRSTTTDASLLIDVSAINKIIIMDSRTNTLLFLLVNVLRKAVMLIVNLRIPVIQVRSLNREYLVINKGLLLFC